MKKISTLALVAFLGLVVFASCKKDYNCKCTATITGTVGGQPYSGTGDSTITIMGAKKKDANSKCDAFEADIKKEMDAAILLINGMGGTASGSASCNLTEQ